MKVWLALLVAIIMIFPNFGFAQEAGSFVGGFDLGITSATGDFRNDTLLDANTGFGIGVEASYYLFNGISIGPFLRYHRFGSGSQSSQGAISYNFAEYGGDLRLNFMHIQNGKIYLMGAGGLFKPKSHLWTPDYTDEFSFQSGTMFTAGLGISSNRDAATIYSLEVRYNFGNADLKYVISGNTYTDNYKFDFIYILMKLSFNSKGIQPPPRY